MIIQNQAIKQIVAKIRMTFGYCMQKQQKVKLELVNLLYTCPTFNVFALNIVQWEPIYYQDLSGHTLGNTLNSKWSYFKPCIAFDLFYLDLSP